MLLTLLSYLLYSNGLTLRSDSSILFRRVTVTILFYCLISALTSFPVIYLGKRVDLYGGLFNISPVTLIVQIFIIFICILILGVFSFQYVKKETVAKGIIFFTEKYHLPSNLRIFLQYITLIGTDGTKITYIIYSLAKNSKFINNCNTCIYIFKDGVCKVLTPGVVLSALLLKANNGELLPGERHFLRGICSQARVQNFDDRSLSCLNLHDASLILANHFHAELHLLITLTTNDHPLLYDHINNQVAYSLITSDIYMRYFHIMYHYSDASYRQMQFILAQYEYKQTKMLLMDTRLDTLAHYYFDLWSKNFSITGEQKNSLYTAYGRYFESRLARDSAFSEFKLDAKGALLNIKSGFSNDAWSIMLRDKFTFNHYECLSEVSRLGIEQEKLKYLRWIEREDCLRIMKPLLDLQEKNLIDQNLDLRSIDFSTVTQSFFPFMHNLPMLTNAEVDAIINSLQLIGVV